MYVNFTIMMVITTAWTWKYEVSTRKSVLFVLLLAKGFDRSPSNPCVLIVKIIKHWRHIRTLTLSSIIIYGFWKHVEIQLKRLRNQSLWGDQIRSAGIISNKPEGLHDRFDYARPFWSPYYVQSMIPYNLFLKLLYDLILKLTLMNFIGPCITKSISRIIIDT